MNCFYYSEKNGECLCYKLTCEKHYCTESVQCPNYRMKDTVALEELIRKNAEKIVESRLGKVRDDIGVLKEKVEMLEEEKERRPATQLRCKYCWGTAQPVSCVEWLATVEEMGRFVEGRVTIPAESFHFCPSCGRRLR